MPKSTYKYKSGDSLKDALDPIFTDYIAETHELDEKLSEHLAGFSHLLHVDTEDLEQSMKLKDIERSLDELISVATTVISLKENLHKLVRQGKISKSIGDGMSHAATSMLEISKAWFKDKVA